MIKPIKNHSKKSKKQKKGSIYRTTGKRNSDTDDLNEYFYNIWVQNKIEHDIQYFIDDR